MITNFLGNPIPADYLQFIENHQSQDFWLTMYPNTENQFSEEVFIWTKDELLAHSYDSQFVNYQYLAKSGLDFSQLDFNAENGQITAEEVQNGFVIGSLNGGFIFLNLSDASVWVWYADMFCQKQVDSFTEFQKLLTSEPLDDDFEDEDW